LTFLDQLPLFTALNPLHLTGPQATADRAERDLFIDQAVTILIDPITAKISRFRSPRLAAVQHLALYTAMLSCLSAGPQAAGRSAPGDLLIDLAITILIQTITDQILLRLSRSGDTAVQHLTRHAALNALCFTGPRST